MTLEIMLPVDQKNTSGLWNESPSVDDQADLVDDGVDTHDGDATHIWTVTPGNYLTLTYGPMTHLGVIPGFKMRLVTRGVDTSSIRGLYVLIALSGQLVAPAKTLNLSAIPDTWTMIYTTWLASDFIAPWVGLTGQIVNDEITAGPKGLRTLWQAKAISAGEGEPPVIEV